MNEYKVIPSFPMFELCDTVPMEFCIRTVDTKEYLNVWLNNNGYPRVTLRRALGGDGKKHYLHRLVAETYIGNIPEDMEIDHVNCDKLCFLHTNLRIVSHKENCNNKISLKHMSEAQKTVQKTAQDFRKKCVQQIDIDTDEIVNEYFGIAEAGRKTGIRHICECCNGTRKSAGGFIWKYKTTN